MIMESYICKYRVLNQFMLIIDKFTFILQRLHNNYKHKQTDLLL